VHQSHSLLLPVGELQEGLSEGELRVEIIRGLFTYLTLLYLSSNTGRQLRIAAQLSDDSHDENCHSHRQRAQGHFVREIRRRFRPVPARD
jgi:hypothetical protein